MGTTQIPAKGLQEGLNLQRLIQKDRAAVWAMATRHKRTLLTTLSHHMDMPAASIAGKIETDELRADLVQVIGVLEQTAAFHEPGHGEVGERELDLLEVNCL